MAPCRVLIICVLFISTATVVGPSPEFAAIEEFYRVNIHSGMLELEGHLQLQFMETCSSFNLTLPIELETHPELNSSFKVLEGTPWGNPLDHEMRPAGSRTIVTVTPDIPFQSEEINDIYFKCEIQALYNESWFVAQGPTAWDRILGRSGENFATGFAPFLDSTPGNLEVRMRVPVGFVVKGWDPSWGRKIAATTESFHQEVGWSSKGRRTGGLEFTVVWGKGGLGSRGILLILSSFAAVTLVVVAALLHIRREHSYTIKPYRKIS